MAAFTTLAELGTARTHVALQLIAKGPMHDHTTFADDSTTDPVGTATLLAPYLAVTAKHVVQDYMRTFRMRVEATMANYSLYAAMFTDPPVLFTVDRVTGAGSTDVAFLHLAPTVGLRRWPAPVLDLAIPRIGSPVAAIGYHSARVVSEGRIYRDVALSTGHVIEVFDLKRDSRLNFPCFQTDARFVGGMSGGPVFNEHGYLCGIVSSSLSPSPGEPDVSYAALLWALTVEKLHSDRRGADGIEPVIQLMRDGVIKTVGLELIQSVTEDATGALTVQRLARPPD
jgi:S1-C subfamily serine protease